MKKLSYLSYCALLAVLIIMPMAVRAEDDAMIETSTSVETNASAENSGPGAASAATIRERLRAAGTVKVDALKTNIRANQEYRNDILETRADMRGIASTSRAEHREIRAEAMLNAFKIRQQALVKQLQLSISNLEQISGRISERMSKAEDAGIDMTEARTSFAAATAKIEKAKAAADEVAAYVPSAPAEAPAAVSASTSIMVNLEKPRKIGADAIAAVKDARDALQETVTSIAHALGKKIPAQATTSVDASASMNQ